MKVKVVDDFRLQNEFFTKAFDAWTPYLRKADFTSDKGGCAMSAAKDRFTRQPKGNETEKMTTINQYILINIPITINWSVNIDRITVNLTENTACRCAGFLKRALFAVMMCIAREIAGSSELFAALAEALAWPGLLLA